jgi:hypothetical protein
VQSFEDLIRSVNDSLNEETKFGDGLRIFEEAAASFHHWQRLQRSSPFSPDLTALERDIVAAEKLDGLFWGGQNASRECDFRLAGEKFSLAASELRQAAWVGLQDEKLHSIGNAQKTLTVAASLLAVSADLLASEVIPKLQAYIADSTTLERSFRTSSSTEVKSALKAARYLHDRGLWETNTDMRSWAQQKLAEVAPQLEASISELRTDIATKLGQRRAAKEDLERENERAMKSWRDSVRAAREPFHDLVQKATELQWDLGPQFLVQFEDTCREQGLHPQTIPWDPARMLGWKLLARGIEVTVYDLQVAAQELSPKALVDNAGGGEPMEPADGSYFTDYVHYIAISKPGVPPRAVARDLVARLLRPAQIIKLIALHGGHTVRDVAASQMADELLDCFGWEKSNEIRRRPLAACLKILEDPALMSEERFSGNDLRIITESFCKDLLDVIVAQLQYREEQVWGAITERAPEYRPSSRPRNWNDEVSHLTIGQAIILLPALGSLAFPRHAAQVVELAGILRTLSPYFNEVSHDQEAAPASKVRSDGILEEVRNLLDRARECLGELPWHLDISTVYGEQPKIISGAAWSHSSATPRLLRVILWAGSVPDRYVLLWNKTGRKPLFGRLELFRLFGLLP